MESWEYISTEAEAWAWRWDLYFDGNKKVGGLHRCKEIIRTENVVRRPHR